MAPRPETAGFDWRRLEKIPPWGWVLLLSTLSLLPLIGSYGLWDAEFAIAEAARGIADHGEWGKIFSTRPPLTIWLSALGIKAFGVSEFGARVPLVLVGIAGAVATFGIGARLRSPRAGLVAAIVLLASPLYVFESRQLTSDIGSVAGAAIAMYGLVRLAWPAQLVSARGLAADVTLAILGLALGCLGSGLLVGVFVPLAAVGLASGIAYFGRFVMETKDGEPSVAGADGDTRAAATRRRHLITAITIGGAALAALLVVLLQYGGTGYLWAFGGTWRQGDPPATATYDFLVDQVGVGMFPWSAVAPLAVLRLAIVKRTDRRAWAGVLVLSWAVVAYAVGTFFTRKLTGELRFPAMAALAVAIGIMIDEVLAARAASRADDESAPTIRAGLPLAALFIFCAAAQLARDNYAFPDELASIHVLTTTKYPTEVKLLPVQLAFGVLFGVLAAIGLMVRPAASGEPPHPVRRVLQHGLLEAVALSYVFGLFLAMVYTPALSQHFSYKNLFDSYRKHRSGDQKLGVAGIPGPGPDYYAHGTYEKLAGQPQIISFLGSPDRVFAISPASDLCALHQKAGAGAFEFHVIDARNSRFLLYSNRLGEHEKDRNPLLRAIRRVPPESMTGEVAATYVPSLPGQKGKIELIGYDMPASVSKGSKFKMTLYFHVTESVTTNYRVFVHFDAPSFRFNGDHDPVENRCGSQQWQTGDYIADTFEVTAGELTSPSGTHDVWVGFFTSSGPGQYKNMTVTSGNADNNNRVKIGSLQVGSKSAAGGCGCSVGGRSR